MESENKTFDEAFAEAVNRKAVRDYVLANGMQTNSVRGAEDVVAHYAGRLRDAHGREVETMRIAACSAQARFDEELSAKNAEVAELKRLHDIHARQAIRDFNRELFFKDRWIAELRECLKESLAGVCAFCANCNGKQCEDGHTCESMTRWRKALEGAKE